MPLSKYNLVIVLGPTACGKTRFAALLANKIDGEIISADSRQVYRKMNLGTGKDYDDYIVNDNIIPCHLIDILEPGQKYNLFWYQNDFLDAYRDLQQRKKMPVVCGGTGLYIDAITNAYKLMPVPADTNLRKNLEQKSLEELTTILSSYKKLHNKTDVDTVKRAVRAIEIEEYYRNNPKTVNIFPQLKSLLIGINFDRTTVKKRISDRLYARLKEGMIDEVEQLLKNGLKPENLIYYGLEYKFITLFLTGEMQYADMVEKLNIAIHQYSKRQMTWFRKMEKEGAEIHWLDGNEPLEARLNKAVKLAGY